MQNSISERLINFASAIVKFTIQQNTLHIHSVLGNQLLRSATSAGANYEEACGSESKADFIHKMQLVLKELKESSYWLKLISRTYAIKDVSFKALQQESLQLSNIIAKSVITAKKNR